MAKSESGPVNRRLTDNIGDEPEQMLQPIIGYEKEPLLSLEEACEPLESILDHQLKQNIFIAKVNTEKNTDGIPHDEAAAIHLYTMEWHNHQNSLYMVLNRTLRAPDRDELRPWFKYLRLLLTGFFRLPEIEHQTVWRGVKENLSDRYPKGEKVTWWALSSCTSAISVLESPHYVGTTGPRTMFSIETASGKFIQSLSYYKREQEILLPPGRYFEVRDRSSPANDLHIIHLREIQPPFMMLGNPFGLSQLMHNLPHPGPPKSASAHTGELNPVVFPAKEAFKYRKCYAYR